MGTKKGPRSDWQSLCHQLERQWPVEHWRQVPTLVAVSGGADSVALLRAMVDRRAEGPGNAELHVAHFHHGIRGAAADGDVEFVQQLAAALQLPVTIGHIDEQAEMPDRRTQRLATDEATLRSGRYRSLGSLAHRLGARYVVTGHTSDDNVETLLHQLFRGTGPAGLAAMPWHRTLVEDVLLIRPLLRVPGETLRGALRELGQAWREDGSNSQSHYKRNWLRHELLPLIESRYPGAASRIAATIEQQRRVLEVIEQQAQQWLQRCVGQDGEAVTVRYQPAPAAVVMQALRQIRTDHDWPRGGMTESHWRQLQAAVASPFTPRFDLPGGIAAESNATHTRLWRAGDSDSDRQRSR